MPRANSYVLRPELSDPCTPKGQDRVPQLTSCRRLCQAPNFKKTSSSVRQQMWKHTKYSGTTEISLNCMVRSQPEALWFSRRELPHIYIAVSWLPFKTHIQTISHYTAMRSLRSRNSDSPDEVSVFGCTTGTDYMLLSY